MAVHHPLIPVKVIAPQLGKQHLPGEHPSRCGQKCVEQFEFPGGQVQRVVLQQRLPGVQIKGQVTVSETALLIRVSSAAENDADLFQQHRHGERLGHIVINIHAEALELLFLTVQRSQHDDRDLRLLADQLTDAKPIDLRQHQVQQDQVKGLGMKHGKGCHTVPSHGSSIACILQIGPQQLLYIQFVLDDQNVFHLYITRSKCIMEL